MLGINHLGGCSFPGLDFGGIVKARLADPFTRGNVESSGFSKEFSHCWVEHSHVCKGLTFASETGTGKDNEVLTTRNGATVVNVEVTGDRLATGNLDGTIPDNIKDGSNQSTMDLHRRERVWEKGVGRKQGRDWVRQDRDGIGEESGQGNLPVHRLGQRQG